MHRPRGEPVRMTARAPVHGEHRHRHEQPVPPPRVDERVEHPLTVLDRDEPGVDHLRDHHRAAGRSPPGRISVSGSHATKTCVSARAGDLDEALLPARVHEPAACPAPAPRGRRMASVIRSAAAAIGNVDHQGVPVGVGEHQAAAGPDDPHQFGDGRRQVGNPLQHALRPAGVEARRPACRARPTSPIRKSDPRPGDVRADPAPPAASPRWCRCRVTRARAADVRAQRDGDVAGAASDVQHALARSQRQPLALPCPQALHRGPAPPWRPSPRPARRHRGCASTSAYPMTVPPARHIRVRIVRHARTVRPAAGRGPRLPGGADGCAGTAAQARRRTSWHRTPAASSAPSSGSGVTRTTRPISPPGLMARAVDAGRRVVCVTATQGEAGFPADDPRSEDERKAVRRAEMAASLAVLGVTEHVWLGYGGRPAATRCRTTRRSPSSCRSWTSCGPTPC